MLLALLLLLLLLLFLQAKHLRRRLRDIALSGLLAAEAPESPIEAARSKIAQRQGA